jgi:Mrp family chromosome partitioning ATPase
MVVVVSAMRNEGKTTVSCIIAAALASLSSTRSVALVDLDMRNPSIGDRFGVYPKDGMEDVFEGRRRLEDVCVRLSNPDLDLYPTCQSQRSAHELIVQPQFYETLQLLETRYSVIVVDTPPCLVVPDASLILKSLGSYVAVARSGVTRVKEFSEMLDLLPREQSLGKVLNHLPAPRGKVESYYYYYGEEDEEKPS